MSHFHDSLTAAQETFGALGPLEAPLQRAADAAFAALTSGRKLLFCGNGGSAADAAHIAAEFVCRFKEDRRPYPALALGVDGGLLTAIGNDYEFNDAFAVSYLQPRINLPQLGGNSELDVHIYPNPASKSDITRIAISSAWKGEITVEVKDAVGRTVLAENTANMPSLNPNQTLDLTLGQFSPGTYLCQIRVKNLSGEVFYRTLPFVIKN